MRMTRATRGILCVVVAGVALAGRATVARAQEAAMLAILRPLVLDSLNGAGVRADQLLIAVDSISARMMRTAMLELGAPSDRDVSCPAGTLDDGRPVPAPVGYRVGVTLRQDSTSHAWVIGVSKSCRFSFRGRQRGFRESGTWELVKKGGRWILGRSLERSIT